MNWIKENPQFVVFIVAIVLIVGAIVWMELGTHQDMKTVSASYAYKIEVIEYDGCEYVMFHPSGSYSYQIVHKGNCKNPIHKEDK